MFASVAEWEKIDQWNGMSAHSARMATSYLEHVKLLGKFLLLFWVSGGHIYKL